MNVRTPGKRTPHKGATPHRTNLEKLTFIHSTRQYGPSPHVSETHTVQVKTSPLPTIYFSSTALAHKAKQSKSLASSLVHKLTNICTRTYQIQSINPSHQPTLAPCHRYSYIHNPPSRPLTAIHPSILFPPIPSLPRLPTSLLQSLYTYTYTSPSPIPQNPTTQQGSLSILPVPRPPTSANILLLLVRYDTSRVSSTRAKPTLPVCFFLSSVLSDMIATARLDSTVRILPHITLHTLYYNVM